MADHNTDHPDALKLINSLGLQVHPEGGWFCETYRSSEVVDIRRSNSTVAPPTTPGDTEPVTSRHQRTALTSCYYLLASGHGQQHFSNFRKLRSDEILLFHIGNPVKLHTIDVAGNYKVRVLGNPLVTPGAVLEYCVTRRTWMAMELMDTTPAFCLISCVMGPGWDLEDFQLGSSSLAEKYPHLTDVINRLVRQ